MDYRVMRAEEFERLTPIYDAMGEPYPVPERTVFYAAEDQGEVVGLIAGQTVVLVSPIWVRRDLRGHGIAERLAQEGYMYLPAGMQKALITTNRHVEMLAHGMGFIPKIGQLWMERPGR